MSDGVPMLDLTAQNRQVRDEILRAITEIVDSQRFILGPGVERLEENVAAYCGCRFGVGVSSGTDALLLALMEAGVGHGDEVITTPYTFFATVGSIVRCGATPVFVDIDGPTFNMDANRVADKITDRTKAVIPVHLFGQCAEMGPLLEVARDKGIVIIEDAAQAIGAECHLDDARRAGSMGRAGCLSFYPSKNLGAFGEAGMVVTNDENVAQALRLLRNHGDRGTYDHVRVGGNFRMAAVQGAVLSVKFRELDGWTAGRQANARLYRELFAEAEIGPDCVALPTECQPRHIYNQFVIRAPRRDELREFLRQRNIGSAVYYPIPMHLQACFANLGHKPGDFPESERAAAESLALPIFAELTEPQIRTVVSAIKDFYSAQTPPPSRP